MEPQRGRPDGVVEVVPEASALAAALERRAEPHQYADGHEPQLRALRMSWGSPNATKRAHRRLGVVEGDPKAI
eukprot:scaffold20553_cov74-Phaeocystis_antarctica.AAC.2